MVETPEKAKKLLITISSTFANLRLDRFLRSQYPGLTIQKWIRKGKIRLDERRTTAGHRLQPGEVIHLPPFVPQLASRLEADKVASQSKVRPLTARERKQAKSAVLHWDNEIIVLNKPYGIAVQAGTKVFHHVDRLLDAFIGEKYDKKSASSGKAKVSKDYAADDMKRSKNGSAKIVKGTDAKAHTRDDQVAVVRPMLVHRLDKDTTGILVVARTLSAARWLGEAFRERRVQKTYWALVVGYPIDERGTVDLPIRKLGSRGGNNDKHEKVGVDREAGHEAVTHFKVLAHDVRTNLSWLELRPETGRGHQLRVHCAVGLGVPVLGDGKYGGQKAHPFKGREKLHLHARRLELTYPSGAAATFMAPLPPHMEERFKMLKFPIRTH